MFKPRAYVLLSGGIDSTTCLYIAHNQFAGNVIGVSIDYGQRHKKEIEHAAKTCAALKVPFQIIDLPFIVPRTMLTDRSVKVPDISYDQIKGVSPTYVPYRNGLMLSAVASVAHGNYVKLNAEGEWGLYFGAHAEDAREWAYPDCTPEFIGAMANAIYVGTYRAIRLFTPLEWLTKEEIILLGDRHEVDWSLTWSCYVGGETHCGICPTCRARRQGFQRACIDDPTVYSEGKIHG